MFSTGYKIYPVENTVYPVGVSSGRISCGEHSHCGEQLWRTLIYPVDDMVYPVENLLWMTISCGDILWRTPSLHISCGEHILWRTVIHRIYECPPQDLISCGEQLWGTSCYTDAATPQPPLHIGGVEIFHDI